MIRALILLLLLSSCGGESKKVNTFNQDLDLLITKTKVVDEKLLAE